MTRVAHAVIGGVSQYLNSENVEIIKRDLTSPRPDSTRRIGHIGTDPRPRTQQMSEDSPTCGPTTAAQRSERTIRLGNTTYELMVGQCACGGPIYKLLQIGKGRRHAGGPRAHGSE